MKDFWKSFEKGLGFATGVVVLAILSFGVYAFVEPSSGPSVDYYIDNSSSVMEKLIENRKEQIAILVGIAEDYPPSNARGQDATWLAYTDLFWADSATPVVTTGVSYPAFPECPEGYLSFANYTAFDVLGGGFYRSYSGSSCYLDVTY